MIGFETMRNATITVFVDLSSILSADILIDRFPYFGSWGHIYRIPKEQVNNIKNAQYIWLSHGHP